MSEPIILLLLRIPVKILNVLTGVIGTVFYTPSYLMFLLIQNLIFGQWVKQSLTNYVWTWPLRLVLLLVSFSLFLAQFIVPFIYALNNMEQTNTKILTISFAVSIPATIYLMRRGYLKALKVLKVPQLKSPMQYVTELVGLLSDLPGILLTLLNVILLKEIRGTLKYEYDEHHRNYLSHIAKLVYKAFFYDLMFSFEMFLSVFSWRRNDSQQLKKEKEPNLHRLSLLMVLSFSTLLDIVVFCLFGWLALLSVNLTGKRFVKLIKYGDVKSYRSYTIKCAFLNIFELLGYISTIPVFLLIFNIKLVTECLRDYRKKVSYANSLTPSMRDWKEIQENAWYENEIQLNCQLYFVLVITFVRVLLFGFRVIVFLTVYKEKRMKIWKEEREKKKEEMAKKKDRTANSKGDEAEKITNSSIDFEAQFMYLILAFEFLIDIPFFIMTLVTCILKPWYFLYYWRIFNSNYTLKRQLIFLRFIRAIAFYLCLALMVVLLPLYIHRLRWLRQLWRNIKLEEEEKRYKLNNVFVQLLSKIADDFFMLPLYYCMVACGTFLFKQERVNDFRELPHIFDSYIDQIKCLYYRIRVGRNQKFQEMYVQDERFLKNMHCQVIFWSTALAIRRINNICWFLSLLPRATVFRKSYYKKNVQKIKNKEYTQNCSTIAKEYDRAKCLLAFHLECNLTILIEIVIGLVVTLILLPLTSWRLPTLIAIYRDEHWYNQVTGSVAYRKPHERLVILVVSVLILLLQDIPYILLHIFTLLTCPIRQFRYLYKEAYRYQDFNRTISFQRNLKNSRQFFIYQVFLKNLKTFTSLVESFGVFITLVRIKYLYHLVKKAKHSFSDYFLQLFGLEKMLTEKQYRESREKVVEEKPWFQGEIISIHMCIHIAFREAIKDIPFAILSIMILVLFPWRIFYLLNILKDQHERLPIVMRNGKINVEGKRRKIIELLFNIITSDLLCVLYNIILILSIYKVPKVIELFKKNYWLNLKKGAISYDYKRDLQIEVIDVIINGIVVLKLVLITLMVVRARTTFRRLYRLYLKRRELKRIEAYNRFVREQTKKAGHQQRLTYIGFMAFRTICGYLEPDDLDHLQRANKDLYIWTNDEQIWQDQWESRYKKMSSNPGDIKTYKELVGETFASQRKPKQKEQTYMDIVNQQIIDSLEQPIRIQDFVSEEKLMYPSWHEGGFGGLQQSDQMQILFYYLILIPRTFIIEYVFIPCFRNETLWLVKQFLFIGFVIGYIIMWLLVIWFNLYDIFSIGRLIALKIMLIMYLIIFHFVLILNINRLGAHQVPAFYPFDAIRIAADTTLDVLSAAGRKVKNFVIKTVTPFYKFLSKILAALGEGIVKLAHLLGDFLSSIFTGILKIITSIKDIILGIGKGYLQILAEIMNALLKFGRLGDLIFTPIALAYLSLPLILSYLFYWKAVAIVPSSILTAILYIRGYSVLNRNYRR